MRLQTINNVSAEAAGSGELGATDALALARRVDWQFLLPAGCWKTCSISGRCPA